MEQNPSTPQTQIPAQAPPPKKSRKKTLLTAIIAIVVVVMVVVAVILVTLPSISTPRPHFGFVSLSTVEDNTNNTALTKSSIITFTSSSSITNLPKGLVKGEEVFFNSTSGEIMTLISQFSNSSVANSFYLNQMSNLTTLHVSLTYSIYDSFNYSYASVTLKNTYASVFIGIAGGHSGSFVFLIIDLGIPTSNFNSLIQAQISAMVQ